MYNCSMQLKLKHTNFIILANGTSTNYTFPVYKYSITFTLTIKSKIIYKDGYKIVPQFLPLLGQPVSPAILQHENYLN